MEKQVKINNVLHDLFSLLEEEIRYDVTEDIYNEMYDCLEMINQINNEKEK